MDIEARVVGVEKGLEYVNERVNDLEVTTKRIESLTLSVEKLAFSMEAMAKEQISLSEQTKDLSARIGVVEQQPYKDKASIHDKVVNSVSMVIIGALVGFLLNYFFGI